MPTPLTLQRRLNRQPQNVAVIDRSDSLGSNLAAAYTPSLLTNPVNGFRIGYGASVSRKASREGIASQHAAMNAAVDIGAPGGINTIVPPGTPISVFMRVYAVNTGVRQIFFGDYNSGGGAESFSIEINASGNWRFSTWDSSATQRSSSGGLAADGWHDVWAIHVPGLGQWLYVDGQIIASTPYTSPLRNGVALRIGMPGLANLLGWQGLIAACFIFRGDQSSRILDMSANPWRVFAAPIRTFRVGAVGALTGQLQLGWTEAGEISSANVPVQAKASLGWAEQDEAVRADLTQMIASTAIWVESDEFPQTAALIRLNAAISWLEQDDAYSARVAVTDPAVEPRLTLSWQEQDDISAVTGCVIGRAAVAWIEQGDSSAAQIRVGTPTDLRATWVEQDDTVRLRANVETEGDIDALLVPPRQTVVFEGSRRVVAFEGGKRVVSFEGSKRLVEFP